MYKCVCVCRSSRPKTAPTPGRNPVVVLYFYICIPIFVWVMRFTTPRRRCDVGRMQVFRHLTSADIEIVAGDRPMFIPIQHYSIIIMRDYNYSESSAFRLSLGIRCTAHHCTAPVRAAYFHNLYCSSQRVRRPTSTHKPTITL